ncbi:MAG: 3-dehydroquinate synthase, partial [Alistipes sp.]|nr:3-dehydroquinate synthase [Alistipes sp.]
IGRGAGVKTLQTVETIYRRFIELGVDRSTFVLAVGGGIVTDTAGFAASTYMRGLDFGFVSTTLLGQVDASVGGKNGVNVDGYKNMAGTFTQPQFVICDPVLLATLPDREFRAGLAEAVKAAVIADEELFARLEEATFEELRRNTDLLSDVISAAIRVKADIVERDEREGGERRKLNLGHTLAHAIEKSSDRMNHGEAVAVGTVLIARAAVRLGVLAAADCDRIAALLAKLGFVLESPVGMDRLLREVAKDKKNKDGELRIVLPTRIGDCDVRPFTPERFAELFV